MIARELGAYYGFRTSSLPYPSAHLEKWQKTPVGSYDSQSGSSTDAGYYTRTGESHRRYLVLDGAIRSNFYSMVVKEHYHEREPFQWTMAVLFAIAKWTDRILILPQVFNDEGM
jgi:hypothetical protein